MGTKRATTPPPERPYRPRTIVRGDKLPVRYKASPASDARLAKAARRAILAEIYFGQGGGN